MEGLLRYETSREAVAFAEESADIFSKAWAYLAYGSSCYGRGLFEEALEYLSKGADCCAKIDAYNILKLPRDPLKEAGDEDEKRYFITISVYEEHKELFKDVLDTAKEILNTESNSIAIMYIMYNWGISAIPEPNME